MPWKHSLSTTKPAALNPIKEQHTHISLPLETFLQQLEIAGFRITPATRLSVLRVLQSVGKANLQNPQKLKYLLAPVIAKSETEQKRFYDLFEVYWKELNAPLSEPPAKVEKTNTEPPPPDNRLPNWFWLGIGALTVGLTIWALSRLLSPTVLPLNPTIAFKPIEAQHKLEDTLFIENLSINYDTIHTKFIWELIDEATGTIEQIDSLNYHGTFHLKTLENKPQKQLRLIAHHRIEKTRDSSKLANFTITCQDLVKIVDVIAPKQVDTRKDIKFEVITEPKEDPAFQYSWDFDDGKTARGPSVMHSFPDFGIYQVKVTVEKIGTAGECQAIKIHTLSIGQKAPLAEKTLRKDTASFLAFFNWGTWWLLAMLAMLTLFFWRRWWKRPTPVVIKEDKTAFFQSVFSVSDKAPYDIPFKQKETSISIEAGLFRMADTMRVRQEGLRKVLDVSATIKATAEQGGFPSFQMATKTKPPEYLFLIDQENNQSHQSSLFQFITHFLQKNDVYIEVFFYHAKFNRVWNKSHPEGMSLSQLARLYAHYRLIILGDAYSLLDTFSQQQPQLQKETTGAFKSWKNRVLLTPTPMVSWTFREGVLYEMFKLFPADLQGVQTAMNYLESEQALEGDGGNSFKKWRSEQQSLRDEIDINYRKWTRIKTYQDYLKDHPKVYQWLMALAVYPEPNWNITLAIGKKLQSQGVEVSYDNLLLLARIPCLRTGVLTASLRQQFLQALDLETEILARQAVKEVLEAIKEKVANSHAHFEFQSQLAIQNFILRPDKKSHQEAIRYLNDQALLTKSQTKELNLNLQKKHSGETDIITYLQKTDLAATPPPRPFYTPDFTRAAGLTGLFLILVLLLGMLNGSDWLNKKANASNELAARPQDNFFLQYIPTDSAAIYNNLAVDQFQQLKKDADISQLSLLINKDYYTPAIQSLLRATEIRTGYQIATENLGKLCYNLGVQNYSRAIAANKIDASYLNQSLAEFKSILIPADSILFDTYHAKGLVYWYLNKKDSSKLFLDNIDPVFFDTLSLNPNLKILWEADIPATTLTDNPTDNQSINLIGVVIDANTKAPIDRVLVEGGNIAKLTNIGGVFILGFPKKDVGKTRQLSFSKTGYRSKAQSVLIRADQLEIELDPIADARPIPASLTKIIIDLLGIEPSEVKASANFTEDLGADELDFVEIVMDVEKAYNINIPDAEVEQVKTVGQLAQVVVKRADPSYFLDSDADGILDTEDFCPNIKGSKNDKGCPPLSRSSFKDERDGKVYQTVTVAGKTWMAENLNHKTLNSTCYNDKSSYCNQYGQLYALEEAKIACPKGWYLPSDADWQNLLKYYGKGQTAYAALIQGGESSLNFRLGGWKSITKGKYYYDVNIKGEYWSSSPASTNTSYRYSFNQIDKSIYRNEHENELGYSCRCVKN